MEQVAGEVHPTVVIYPYRRQRIRISLQRGKPIMGGALSVYGTGGDSTSYLLRGTAAPKS